MLGNILLQTMLIVGSIDKMLNAWIKEFPLKCECFIMIIVINNMDIVLNSTDMRIS